MPKNVQIFFSNQLEYLYQNLKASLFPSECFANPLMRQIIVVYGPAMKTWLMTRMARDSDLGIAFGLEFIYLNKTFDHLLDIATTQKSRFPSQIELRFAIEHEFTQIIKNYSQLSSDEKRSWLPFVDYLKFDPFALHNQNNHFLSLKVQKRLIGLSEHLSSLFQDYGKHAPEMLMEWENEKYLPDNWQARLWNRVYKKYSWNYPAKALKNPICALDNTAIYFFSISFITMTEFAFLHELSKKCLISYYMLSPCAVFWTDIRSDREAAYIQSVWTKKLGKQSSQVLQLDELLQDRNPLLANFGRLGRQMTSQIEQFDALTYANYAIPSSAEKTHAKDFESEDAHLVFTEKPLSLLQAIQSDVLLMRSPQHDPIISIQNDPGSIQLHIASSPRREIEILYHNILDLLVKDRSLTPGDIIVMAPEIKRYVPYIRNIFGEGTTPLDFQILDLEMQTQNDIVQGFLQLFELSESRWESSRILQLFAHPCFQQRHAISLSEYQFFHKWITKAGILWGSDAAHRNEVLQRNHCDQEMIDARETGTWEHGFHRLLFGLTTIFDDEIDDSDPGITPCASIDFSQSELLSKCIHLLHSLRDDLSPLHDHSQMSVENWTKYLHCLLQNYFSPDPKNADSSEEYTALEEQLERLRSSSYFLKNGIFSFSSIRSNLISLLQHCAVSYREDSLSVIQFCSLLPLRSIPAKVICILGLQEDAFPRSHPPSSLDLSKQRTSNVYSPSSIDFDRYLFLETLHSAQQHLLLSFQGYSAKDGKETHPSLLVQELFSYCDTHYLLDGEKLSTKSIFRHPFHSFNEAYFTSPKLLKNYSSFDWKISASYREPSSTSPNFINNFMWKELSVADLSGHIEIHSKHLIAMSRNPIKFHMNHILRMYLQTEEDRKSKFEEELTLSPLDKFQLKQLSLKKHFDKVMKFADREGILPFGLFKEVAASNLKNDIDDMHNHFKRHLIDPSSLATMEFSSACALATQLSTNHWLFPSPCIALTEKFSVSIVGKITQVSPRGLIAMNKGSLSDLWKTWPQFLLFCCGAIQCPDSFQQFLVLPEAKKEKRAFFDNPYSHLSRYLWYYLQCKEQFSPLIPEWIPFILENDSAGLQEKMASVHNDFFRSYSDPYIKWAIDHKQMPDAELIIRDWNPIAKEQLGDIVDHWMKSSPKDTGEGNERV